MQYTLYNLLCHGETWEIMEEICWTEQAAKAISNSSKSWVSLSGGWGGRNTTSLGLSFLNGLHLYSTSPVFMTRQIAFCNTCHHSPIHTSIPSAHQERYTSTHTHTPFAMPSGAIWSSVSCPRTLWEVDQWGQGLKHHTPMVDDHSHYGQWSVEYNWEMSSQVQVNSTLMRARGTTSQKEQT